MTTSPGKALQYSDGNRLGSFKIAEMAVAGALMLGINIAFGTFEHLWMDWRSPSIDRTYNMAIPLLSAIFVALKWPRLKTTPVKASLWGLPLLLFGMALRMLAEPGQVKFLTYFSLVIVLAGTVWMILGTKMFRELLFPLCYLMFMTPVPDPIYQRMALPMQEMAAKAGYAIGKGLGVGVDLSGRMLTITSLDPPLPLSVAEACSGMKSLLTLLAVAVAFAYITRRDWPTRIFIALSAIPIAIVMNMLRVAGVGVLAVQLGREAAEGFIHWAQGLVFYIVEIVLLFLEGALISWIFGKPPVEVGRATARNNPGGARSPARKGFSAAGITSVAALALFMPLLHLYHENVKGMTAGLEPKMPLEEFASGAKAPSPYVKNPDEEDYVDTDMDLRIEGQDIQYIGFREKIRIDVLKAAEVDSHINIRYLECPMGTRPETIDAQKTNSVLAYVAFHKSASAGINRGAVHYPDQCYPGSGYNTAKREVVAIKTPGYCGGETEMAKSIFYNNRGDWILVYYHMNNNGRGVVDRSAGKIDNFWKLLLGQRTGFMAQVQFYTYIGRGAPMEGGIDDEKTVEAEERLRRFCPVFLRKLGEYLPEAVK